MKTNELIAILRDEDNPNVLDYIDDAADALESQQKRIEELEAERHWIPGDGAVAGAFRWARAGHRRGTG